MLDHPQPGPVDLRGLATTPRGDPRPPGNRLLHEIIAEYWPHPGLRSVMILLSADQDCRAGKLDNARALLELAAARLPLDFGGPPPDLSRSLDAIAMATQAAARWDAGRCCAAVSVAVLAVMQDCRMY